MDIGVNIMRKFRYDHSPDGTELNKGVQYEAQVFPEAKYDTRSDLWHVLYWVGRLIRYIKKGPVDKSQMYHTHE